MWHWSGRGLGLAVTGDLADIRQCVQLAGHRDRQSLPALVRLRIADMSGQLQWPRCCLDHGSARSWRMLSFLKLV